MQYVWGWDILEPVSENPDIMPMVSIVVACRNEEKSIIKLIDSLKYLDYPESKYEIIFVDDFSTDKTTNILQSYQDKINFLQSPKAGKKNAIAHGVKNAIGKFILTTDADCIVPKKWIQSHVSMQVKNNSLLQLGLVDYISQNLFQKILNLEFYSLIGSAAGSAARGKPILSNAANMFIKKNIFLDLQQHLNTKTPSGDDAFLLQEFKKKYPGKIVFNKSKDCIVKTNPPENFHEFLNQRLRWASKNKYFTDKDIMLSGTIVLSFNITLFIWLISGIFDLRNIIVFSFLLVAKSISDFILLNKVSRFFGKSKLMILFLPIQLVYPIYVAIIGIFSFFTHYQWKERKYS